MQITKKGIQSPNSKIKEILKDMLNDISKELKTWNSNKEDSMKVALQNEDALAHLKLSNGHVVHNVFKQHQSLINNTTSPFDIYHYWG